MNIRTKHTTVTFTAAFALSGVDEIQPPGDYAIDEDEELIDGLSWLAYQHRTTSFTSSHFLDRRPKEPTCGYRPF